MTTSTLQDTLDVREIAPRERHPLIFGSLARLGVGDSLLLVNDHDPKPLYYQIQAEAHGEFGWEYVEEGPEVWRVSITRVRGAAAPAAGGCQCGH